MPRKPPARVVVITGASHGIGRALALEFALAGDALVLGSRRESSLDIVRRDCEALHAMAIARVTDSASQTDVYELANVALARFKRVDVWINCASASPRDDSASSTTDPQLDVRCFEHGATAALACFELLGRGVLINIDATPSHAEQGVAWMRNVRRRISDTFAAIDARATAVSGVRVTSVQCGRNSPSSATVARRIVALAHAMTRRGIVGQVHGALERERFRVLLRAMPRDARRKRAMPLIGNKGAYESNHHGERDDTTISSFANSEPRGPQEQDETAELADRDTGTWRLASTPGKHSGMTAVTLLLGVPAAVAALVMLTR